MKKSRNALTNGQKKQIIEYKDAKKLLTHQELADFFSKKFKCVVARKTIGDILKNRDRILECVFNNKENMNRKRQIVYEEIECEMIKWLEMAGNRDFIVTDDILKSKSLEIAKKMKNENFKASNGWLVKFKKRNNLKVNVLCGETGGISVNNFTGELDEISKIIGEYDACDIWNMDETGLNYREIPSKTISSRPKKGFKKNKERITIVFCVNSDGSEKYEITIIGKSKKPRCFNTLDVQKYCNYQSTKKAWLNTLEFKKWLFNLNEKFRKEKRKIVLLLDNAPSHKILTTCSNINIVFLPPNSTGLLQPLDAGIIRSFKASYKKYLLRHALVEFDLGKTTLECFKSVTLKDAIIWSYWAWNDVKKETIINCWKKTNLLGTKFLKFKQGNDTEIKKEENLVVLEEIKNNITKLCPDDMLTANEYLDIENQYDDFEIETYNENLMGIENEENMNLQDCSTTEDVLSDELNAVLTVNQQEKKTLDKRTTLNEAYLNFKRLEKYFEETGFDEEIINFLKLGHDILYKKKNTNTRDGNIMDYLIVKKEE